MTIRALLGLAALNILLLGVGAALLWAIRGWRWWSDLLRLAGLAYLLGVGALFVTISFGLVFGIPVTVSALVVTGLALVGGGLVVGRWRGWVRPGLRPPGAFLPRLSVFGALFAAAILVYLEAAFRAGRLARLFEWDAWRVWTIRAKDLYLTGGLDPELLRLYPAYPPGLSGLQAAAFHAMGSPDVVTVHLQQWFLLIGFIAAIGGLLAARVRQGILLPLLLLVLLMPSFTERATWALADLVLGYLIAVAAVLLVLWLEDRAAWRLAAATALMAGALLTKREGLLLVVCLVLASLAASWRDRRWAWQRLALSALVAVGLALPWRIWIVAEGLRGEGPETGLFGFLHDADRAWPSAELVVRTFFDYDLWLLMPVLVVASIAFGFLAGARQLGVFSAVFLGASLAASTWAIWANPIFEFSQDSGRSPVVRLDGGTILVLATLAPLLLERAWSGRGTIRRTEAAEPRGPARLLGRAGLPWAIVLVAVVAYPGSMLAGYSGLRLPGGAPPFPSADDCVRAPVAGSGVRLVFGYEASYPGAFALRDRARTAGFREAEIEQDGCGRLRVFVDDLSSIAVTRDLVRDTGAAGLEPTVEADPDA